MSLREEETVEARVAALMENLAVGVMQADNLAADSPEYEALARSWPTRWTSRTWVYLAS
jgi:hypothetical protein